MDQVAQLASFMSDELPRDEYHVAPQQQAFHHDSQDGSKRKAADGMPQPLQRSKRNRYISIACNECKRRKIKCNGESPCHRCGNLDLECVYAPNCCNNFKDTPEFKDMSAQISSLQDNVTALYHELNNLRAQLSDSASAHPAPVLPPLQQNNQASIDPSLQLASYPAHRFSQPGPQGSPRSSLAPLSPSFSLPRNQSQNNHATFQGPTSSAFNFSVAEKSLKIMGIASHGEEEQEGRGSSALDTREASPATTANLPLNLQIERITHADKDPIWSVSQDEALRLCKVYEDEMGQMYPIVDIDKVIAYASKLYRFMEAAHRSGLMQQGLPGADAIDDEDTNILKMVLAIAMTVEASGCSDLGKRMFQYVKSAIDTLLLGPVGTKSIRLLTMTAMYEFHCDNEASSWRIIGLTARLCIELGLHRRETYNAIKDESERSETILLFWAIYVLDRRWSFGTGMPFAIQDSDIDPLLPKPEEKSQYLGAMIKYSALGSKVWHTVSNQLPSAENPLINIEDMDYLDYQVIQWHRNIPPHLRIESVSQVEQSDMSAESNPSRGGHRLRLLLYLRGNQMRILIHRPVLHSATSIMRYRKQAQNVVDIAKDTIRILTHVNRTSDLYRAQQVLFNAFLTSALAVLFLAVSHAPAVFASNVREEFYWALDLVRGFSKESWISKRLWKTIRVLKEYGPKLGLLNKDAGHSQPRNVPENSDLDPSRSAAVAMAGLAGHNVDETEIYGGNVLSYPANPSTSTSPAVMVDDLTSLFEAAGGYMVGGNGEVSSARSQDGLLSSPAAVEEEGRQRLRLGLGDDGLSNILKELF